ncbi:MAG: hypothetical protein IJE28_03905 [Oscillospiraceae bacterium]|nr:hypothetical protein [Oscillospiraceae bacterium]MBQ3501248.1 hypothetical protein [Oscillospiraceae bacterium]MBQ4643885.1 hypothetical protein [Oscillospiraceae bacterium]
MKKLLPIFLLLLILCSCGNNNEEKTADYCFLINEQIKQYDFQTAKIEPKKIVLYGEKMSVINEIDFPGYDKNIDIIYIEKYENKIHFAVSGWLDDSAGFMIINGEADFSEIMEGIWSIEKYKNNIYKYKTYP